MSVGVQSSISNGTFQYTVVNNVLRKFYVFRCRNLVHRHSDEVIQAPYQELSDKEKCC